MIILRYQNFVQILKFIDLIRKNESDFEGGNFWQIAEKNYYFFIKTNENFHSSSRISKTFLMYIFSLVYYSYPTNEKFFTYVDDVKFFLFYNGTNGIAT